MTSGGDRAPLRIAAAADQHYTRDADRERVAATFADVAARADLILLPGDLTMRGEPREGDVVADACRGLEVPVLAVLGNHDWHAGRRDELVAVLRDGDIDVIDRDHRVLDLGGRAVGVAGVKGFVGGFGQSHMADLGEPLLRRVYAEAGEEVAALDAGLRAIAGCAFRIALLHYAPVSDTLQGERPELWPLLGTDRLAAPIAEHAPDVVLHGHAHVGSFRGAVGPVPVYNVALPVLGRDFWEFELTGDRTHTRG
jgi:Icc-related predicted phosphoesterase